MTSARTRDRLIERLRSEGIENDAITARKGEQIVGAFLEGTGDAGGHLDAPAAAYQQGGFDIVMAQDGAAERGGAAEFRQAAAL